MDNYIWKKYNTNSTIIYSWRQYNNSVLYYWKTYKIEHDYQGNPIGRGSYVKDVSSTRRSTYPDWGWIGDGSSNVYYTYDREVESKGTYRGNVTSTSSTAYPTNGKQGSYWYDTRTSSTVYSQGSYIGEFIAEDGVYPINGLHSDGYWYVRGEMVLLAIYKNQSIKTIKYKNQDINMLYNRGKTLWHTDPYVYLAQDSDFVKVNGHWVYRGAVLEIEIPTHINGELVTSTQHMFDGSTNYQATPVTKVILKHSNVTNMNYMFSHSKATVLDLSNFNTSNVTSMNNMFFNSNPTTINLSNFNTSKVTNMSYMFSGSKATILNLSNFNTSKVTNMNSMFSGSKATILNLSNFNTSNVTNMSFMFQGSSATTLDLYSFNTSNVTNMSAMFMDCSSLTSLDLSSFDTTKLVTTTSMFENCISITIAYARTQADINKFNASSNKPTGLSFVYLAQDSDFVKYSSRWVYRGAALEVEIPTHINGELVTSTYSMFRGGSTYKATPVTKVVLNHSNVTNMGYMFRDSSVTTLDLPIFDTSNVTNMSYMFYNSKATILDLSSFDTSKVTSRSYMFRNSSATIGYARTQADADKFNASSQKPAGLTFIVKP